MNRTDNRFRIAFLTSEPAYDKGKYSGSLYYMGKALAQHCGDVTYIEYVNSWQRRCIGRITREAAKHHLKWQNSLQTSAIGGEKTGEIGG